MVSTAKVEETLTAAPADHSGMSSALRRNLSSPWATALVIIITILWTIPTLGLLVTSLRPAEVANTTGWWTAFTNPSFTLSNYTEVLNGGAIIPGGITPYFVNSFVISIPAAIIPLVLALHGGVRAGVGAVPVQQRAVPADLRPAGRPAADGAAAAAASCSTRAGGSATSR